MLTQPDLTNSKLKYREEVKRHTICGEISPGGRAILDIFRSQLSLPLEAAAEIEEQVLQSLRKYQKNLQQYRAVFMAEIKREYPLSQASLTVLKDLQTILGLQKEDTVPIENEAILEKEKLEQLHVQATEKELVIQGLREEIAPIEKQLINEIDSNLRTAINWLYSQQDFLVKRACREVQKENPQLSEDELDDFSFQLEQYLDLIRRAIVAQSNNLLQEPHPPLLPNISLYMQALEIVKTRIPEDMHDRAKVELKSRLDYLKARL